MIQHENGTIRNLPVGKLIGLGSCPKRKEFFSLDLLKSDEKSDFRAELLKLHGTYLGKANALQEIEKFIYSHVQTEWYRMESQYEILLHEEAAYHKRLASFFIGKNIIARNLSWSYPLELQVGNHHYTAIYGYVHGMIREADGNLTGVILSEGTPKYSSRARKLRNKPEYAPELIAAYLGLHRRYGKNVKIAICYTRGKNDAIDKEFDKSTQYIIADFSRISEEELKTRLLNLTLSGSEDFQCSNCSYASLCLTDSNFSSDEPKRITEMANKEPKFTANQREVVNFMDGACAVYAVPGAGKTTTLVYRLLKLLDSGIDPRKILFVTFTNKACEEIKSRILALLHTDFEEQLPDIFTYNGLGWQILKEQSQLIGEPKLLTSLDEKKILMECIDLLEKPLLGYSYHNIEGKYGLLTSLLASFRKLNEDEEKEIQTLTENGHDANQVMTLKTLYDSRLRSENYIDFDGQITLSKDLLENHPEVCAFYGNRWEYIMADEYQDSSKENVELLYLIANAGKRNLVVVGDTDQSIYEWRNGSPKYLLEFDKHYPYCKKIYMNDNFRSVRQILDASNALIAKNEQRIDMFMVAHKECNVLPFRVRNCSIDEVPSVLEILKKRNYHYGDIAILSRSNAPLIQLKQSLEKLGISSIGPADFLVNDPVYYLVKDTLSLFFCGFQTTDYEFYRFMKFCGFSLPQKKDPTLTYYHNLVAYHGVIPIRHNDTATILRYELEEDLDDTQDSLFFAYQKLYFLFLEMLKTKHPADFVRLLVRNFSLDANLPSILELLRIIDFENINDLGQFFSYLKLMEDLNDSRKMELEVSTDKVNLMTAHSSKGKEFPAVIILQAEDFDVTEEERRLFYVAMTRAKKCLFLLESPGKACLLLKDIEEHLQNLSF